MNPAAWRAMVIIGGVALLLTLNAREFKAKRRALAREFGAAGEGTAVALSRHQAATAQNIEQLLHMIHTMLAAILVALLWR